MFAYLVFQTEVCFCLLPAFLVFCG